MRGARKFLQKNSSTSVVMFSELHRMQFTLVILAAITCFPLVAKSLMYVYVDHSQGEHSSSHGSVSNTIWLVHGNDDGINVEGRRYAAGDLDAHLLCSLVCKSLGRYIHVTTCRSGEAGICGGGLEVKHIPDMFLVS
jgi:hypothetical protein